MEVTFDLIVSGMALALSGVGWAFLGCDSIFRAGQEYDFWKTKNKDLAQKSAKRLLFGHIRIVVACACFYIAGTMAGVQ